MRRFCQEADLPSGDPSYELLEARPTRGPTGSATAAGRPPPALAVAPQPALCEGWPATGTLVRKTSRVKPRRLRADDDRIILNPPSLVKFLGKVPLICS